MRPGSPVRPLHSNGKPPDDFHEIRVVDRIVEKVVEKTVPPAAVWVAVAVWTKAVVVADRRNVPATASLGGGVGRAGIFAAATTATHTEESHAAEVVAVTLTQGEAVEAVEVHKRAHGDGCEYQVSEQPVGVRFPEPVAAERVAAACIKCGVDVYDGTVYCQPCRKKMFEEAREVDPGDAEPVRRNTYTPPQDRTGRGSGM